MSSHRDLPAVEISIEIAASPQTVFRFLSDPQRMTQWLGSVVEMEPSAGGILRVNFDRFGTTVEGRVVELIPPQRAVYTWGVAAGPQAESMPPGSTRVVVELEPIASGTRLTLRHEGLPSEHERIEHEVGWRYYAGQIARLAGTEERGPRIETVIDAFVAAWSETDAAARRVLLVTSFTDDGHFEDAHAAIDGVTALDAHIAAIQTMMPGLALKREGAAQQVREVVRFAWSIESADGATLARGENVADLAPDSRLRRIIGFADPAQS